MVLRVESVYLAKFERKNKMNKKIVLLIATIFFTLSIVNNSYAVEAIGTIAVIRTHGKIDNKITWLQITGVNNIAGCTSGDFGKGQLNLMVIDFDESQMLSFLLTAYTSNTPVLVNVDVSTVNQISGMCRAANVTLR